MAIICRTHSHKRVQYFASSFGRRARTFNYKFELTLASSVPKKQCARTGSSIFNGFGTECMGTVRTRCHESNFWGAINPPACINLPRRKVGRPSAARRLCTFQNFKLAWPSEIDWWRLQDKNGEMHVINLKRARLHAKPSNLLISFAHVYVQKYLRPYSN